MRPRKRRMLKSSTLPRYDARTTGIRSHARPRRKPCQLPRFADPWCMRKDAAFDRVADFYGREASVSTFRRGGSSQVRAGSAGEPIGRRPVVHLERSMLVELRRRVAATVARYEMQEWLTPAQLRTIRALWIEGLSLREFARREGVAPAAIESRINGLPAKAPEFYRWYRLKNRNRRRR